MRRVWRRAAPLQLLATRVGAGKLLDGAGCWSTGQVSGELPSQESSNGSSEAAGKLWIGVALAVRALATRR